MTKKKTYFFGQLTMIRLTDAADAVENTTNEAKVNSAHASNTEGFGPGSSAPKEITRGPLPLISGVVKQRVLFGDYDGTKDVNDIDEFYPDNFNDG